MDRRLRTSLASPKKDGPLSSSSRSEKASPPYDGADSNITAQAARTVRAMAGNDRNICSILDTLRLPMSTLQLYASAQKEGAEKVDEDHDDHQRNDPPKPKLGRPA